MVESQKSIFEATKKRKQVVQREGQLLMGCILSVFQASFVSIVMEFALTAFQ